MSKIEWEDDPVDGIYAALVGSQYALQVFEVEPGLVTWGLFDGREPEAEGTASTVKQAKAAAGAAWASFVPEPDEGDDPPIAQW